MFLADATVTITTLAGVAVGPFAVAAGTTLNVQASAVTSTAAYLILF